MKKNLVEHIIDEEYVEASDVFAGTLSSILEQKLYEMKRSIDLTEVVKKTRKKNEDGSPVYTGYNTKADWAKYRKQNPQMSFHGTPANPKAKAPAEKKEKTSTGTITSYGLKQRRKRGYVKASDAINAQNFINAVKTHLEKQKQLKEMQANDPNYWNSQTIPDTTGSTPTPKTPDPSHMKKSRTPKGVKKSSERREAEKLSRLDRMRRRGVASNLRSALTGTDKAGNKVSRLKSLGKALDIGSRTNDYQTIRGKSDQGSFKAKAINKGLKFASNVFSTPWQEESYQMQEVLGPNASAVDYIHDFQKSKDSRFKGDSKEKRRQRAIAAYMKQKNKLDEASWKDISKEKKKHPFGKTKNIFKRRKKKIASRVFNEE